jgi:predicted permease
MLPREIRYAFRTIASSPGFAAIAALSLALGIGANAAIFSLVDALLVHPLPVPSAEKIVTVTTDTVGEKFQVGVSYPNYRDLMSRSQSFDGMALFATSTFAFAKSSADVPQRHVGTVVSDNFFKVLGVQPSLGRGFLPQEGEVSSRDAVVVLSYAFWNDQFGGDRSVVGRSVRINGLDFKVVGVASESFTGIDQHLHAAFYVPAQMVQRLDGAQDNVLEDRGNDSWQIKARLKSGVSQARAQSELAVIWQSLRQQYPETNRNREAIVRTELQARLRQSPDAIVMAMLMVLVGLVLIIACANVANLLLGRARSRSREIAVRIALGVPRWRLLRQLLTESLVLSLIGAAIGLFFAYGGVRFLRLLPASGDVPDFILPELNYRVIIFSVLAALVSTVVFGLAPAWQSTRTALVPALKSTGWSMGSAKRTRGRNILVIAQIAVSMVLLVATSMLLDGFRKSLMADPGFRTNHLMMMEFDTSMVRYNPEQTRNFYRNLVDRARSVPGVLSVTLTQSVPFSDQGTSHIIPENVVLPKGQETVSVLSGVVDEHYFETMKIGIVRGRGFTADDKDGSRRVAIVNEEFAKQYWPGQDPIGKRLKLNSEKGPSLEVIGLAKTIKYLFIGESPSAFVYQPFGQNQNQKMFLVAESAGDPDPLGAPLIEIVRALDVNQPIYNIRTFANFYEQNAIYVPLRVMELVGVMGLVGLALALIGIYGLVSYSVACRTKEIGIRMAIGAGKAQIVKMVLREGLLLSGLGIVFGGLMSVAVGRVLVSGLAGLATPNSATFVIVPLAVLLVTMAACYVPARRASVVDPILALRY